MFGAKMRVKELHPWDLEPKSAIECQKILSKDVSLLPSFDSVRIIAGVDASYEKGLAFAGITIFNFPELKLLDMEYSVKQVNYPYISGLLTFREGPALADLFIKTSWNPDIILFDGQGIAHPRKMG